MATISIPFFRAKPGRGGRARYFWDPSSPLRAQGWQTRRLSDDLAEAMAEAKTINAEVERWRAGPNQPQGRHAPGTLAALIETFKHSKEFAKLAAKTRYEYDRNAQALVEWAGDRPIDGIKRSLIVQFYESLYERVPSEANATMRYLRRVLNFAVDRELLTASPMHRFKLPDPGRQTEVQLWTDEMIDDFVAAADAAGRPSIATAVALNAWLGQREGDIITMLRSSYRDGAIFVRQRKTAQEVDLPVSEVPVIAARLAEELARSSAVTIIASESTGRPYTGDNFRKTFQAIRETVPSCKGARFMWLRHTAVTRMAEAGCSNSYIASITGHTDGSIDQIIRRYRTRTRKQAVAAFRMRLAAEAGGR